MIITGNKAKGTAFELGSVRARFKNKGWAFRAPGSGGFTPNKDPSDREGLQLDCTIPLSVAHVDFSYKIEYLTADYHGFDPEWGEVRVVEAKTKRLEKARKEKGKKPKEEKIVAMYYLTEEIKGTSALAGKMRKSDFCIELERTWMLAKIMAESKTKEGIKVFNVPVRPYLHIRFIGTGAEKYFHIPDLIASREPNQDVLKITKDGNNDIKSEWQERSK